MTPTRARLINRVSLNGTPQQRAELGAQTQRPPIASAKGCPAPLLSSTHQLRLRPEPPLAGPGGLELSWPAVAHESWAEPSQPLAPALRTQPRCGGTDSTHPPLARAGSAREGPGCRGWRGADVLVLALQTCRAVGFPADRLPALHLARPRQQLQRRAN